MKRISSESGLQSVTRFAVLFACALFVTRTAAAQGFTVEQVMSSPFPDNLTVAARAPRVAWAFDAKGLRNVWVADGPGFAARQVTHYSDDDGMALASLRLVPDGRTVVYARGSELNSAGEVADPTSHVMRPNQQVWAVDVEKGEPRYLGELNCTREGCEDIELSADGTMAVWAARGQLWIAPVSGAQPAHQLTFVRGENDSPQWSPDGSEIAFVSRRGDHSFIAIYNFGHESLRYLAPSVDRDSMPRWSPDGKQIAFVRIHGLEERLPILQIRPNPWAIYVADVSTGEGHPIWHSTEELVGSLPSLTENKSFHFAGSRIIFASEQDGWNHLYSIAASGGAATLLTPGNFEVEDVTVSRDARSVIYSSNQDDIDRRHLWRVGIDGGKPEILSRGEAMEWSPAELSDGHTVVCLGSTAISPAMPYRLTSSGREMIAASQLPAEFPAAQLIVPKQVTFPAQDGLTIHGQLFVPRGRTVPGPALLFMHGGSRRQMMLGFHYMQYYHNAYAENQYLASRGFVVLSVNYRTGIMYGRAFRERDKGGPRGAEEYQDIVAGAKYLLTLPIVDAKKVGLWGGSYGGFLTAMGLARNSDLFAAGVDFHGVHDWSARGFSRGSGPQEPGGPPDRAEAMRLAFESSPNAAISSWKSPVLLIQGDDDRNVDFSQMVDLVQRLRAQKVPFEQIVYPDEIHDFLLWRSWVRGYKATADFFDRVLVKGAQITGGSL